MKADLTVTKDLKDLKTCRDLVSIHGLWTGSNTSLHLPHGRLSQKKDVKIYFEVIRLTPTWKKSNDWSKILTLRTHPSLKSEWTSR